MKTYKAYKRRMEQQLIHFDNKEDFQDEAIHIFVTEKEGELKRDYYLSEIRENMGTLWDKAIKEAERQNQLNI